MIQIAKFNFPLLELHSAVSGLMQPSSKWRQLMAVSRSPKHTPVWMDKVNASPIKSVLNTQNSLFPTLADALWVVTGQGAHNCNFMVLWSQRERQSRDTSALLSLQSHCKRAVERPTAIAISCTKVQAHVEAVAVWLPYIIPVLPTCSQNAWNLQQVKRTSMRWNEE